MKKLFGYLCLFLWTAPACAIHNPMFGDGAQNAISLYAAQGTGGGSLIKLIDAVRWDISPMTLVMAQYSQPMEIMRLPARMNVNVVQNTAYESNHGLSFFGVGVSWDVVVFHWHGLYVGGGIGPYMRDSHDRYVSSRLVFGEKVFIGARINDCWAAELFTLHFSNGDFTEINHGFNYIGLGMNYSF